MNDWDYPSEDEAIATLADLSHLLGIVLKVVNPGINQEAASALIFDMLQENLSEVVAMQYGQLIANTSMESDTNVH